MQLHHTLPNHTSCPGAQPRPLAWIIAALALLASLTGLSGCMFAAGAAAGAGAGYIAAEEHDAHDDDHDDDH